MSPKTRAFLFVAAVILFSVTTVLITGYSQGYRVDWEKKRVTKTGGLFIKAPPGSSITIDGSIKKQTNIWGGGIFISNLLPKEYDIVVKKQNMWGWGKTLEVKPGLTTEIRNILLPRKNPEKEKIADGVLSFLIAPNQKSIAAQKQDGLWMFNIEQGKETLLSAKKFLIESWSWDSKKLLVKEPAGGYAIYYIENGIVLPLPGNIERLKWHSGNPNKIIYAERLTRDLFEYDLVQQQRKLLFPHIGSYELLGSTILFVDWNTGLMYKSGLGSGSQEQITFTPIENQKAREEIQFFSYGEHVFILDGENKLSRFDKLSGSFVEEARGVTNAVFSSFGKSILYTNTNEILVIYLEDILIQPFRHKNQKDLIMRLSQKIDEAYWYTKDNEHIIFRTENDIKITELDGRDGRNTVDFIELTNTHESTTNTTNLMAYNEKDDKLYFLDRKVLYRVKIK